MRAIEIADWELVGNDAAKPLAGKPDVQMKGRRLDLERWLAQFRQIEIDGVVWRRANRGRHIGKRRERCAMDVAGGDQLHARMALDDIRELVGILEILPVHMPDAGLERRMMQEQ